MKIKIHQINMDLDRHRIKFDDYDSAVKRAGRIDPSIYKTVFDGDVDCGNLEEIYEKFNIDHPVTHQGHSLSLSDVVEVLSVCKQRRGRRFKQPSASGNGGD